MENVTTLSTQQSNVLNDVFSKLILSGFTIPEDNYYEDHNVLSALLAIKDIESFKRLLFTGNIGLTPRSAYIVVETAIKLELDHNIVADVLTILTKNGFLFNSNDEIIDMTSNLITLAIENQRINELNLLWYKSNFVTYNFLGSRNPDQIEYTVISSIIERINGASKTGNLLLLKSVLFNLDKYGYINRLINYYLSADNFVYGLFNAFACAESESAVKLILSYMIEQVKQIDIVLIDEYSASNYYLLNVLYNLNPDVEFHFYRSYDKKHNAHMMLSMRGIPNDSVTTKIIATAKEMLAQGVTSDSFVASLDKDKIPLLRELLSRNIISIDDLVNLQDRSISLEGSYALLFNNGIFSQNLAQKVCDETLARHYSRDLCPKLLLMVAAKGYSFTFPLSSYNDLAVKLITDESVHISFNPILEGDSYAINGIVRNREYKFLLALIKRKILPINEQLIELVAQHKNTVKIQKELKTLLPNNIN